MVRMHKLHYVITCSKKSDICLLAETNCGAAATWVHTRCLIFELQAWIALVSLLVLFSILARAGRLSHGQILHILI